MPIRVAGADGHQGDGRAHRTKKFRRRARAAAVVANFEHLGAQRQRIPFEQPPLLLTLRIAHEQESHRTVPNAHHDARLVGIIEPTRPRRIGREKLEVHIVDGHALSGSHTIPCHARSSDRRERITIRVTRAEIRAIPEDARTQRTNDGRRATGVIRVRVREHERGHGSAVTSDVRNHGCSPGVAASPRTSGVHENPPAPRRAKRDRIALAHVDQM
jgi:hypothetical protein